jgi:hypothetical protein
VVVVLQELLLQWLLPHPQQDLCHAQQQQQLRRRRQWQLQQHCRSQQLLRKGFPQALTAEVVVAVRPPPLFAAAAAAAVVHKELQPRQLLQHRLSRLLLQ